MFISDLLSVTDAAIKKPELDEGWTILGKKRVERELSIR